MTDDPGPGTVTSDSIENRARAALARVRRRARWVMTARADRIAEVLTSAAEGGTPSDEQVRSALRAAHMIAGSAGTVGIPEASVLAREVETFLESGALADAPKVRDALAIVDRLRSRLAEGATSPSGDPADLTRRREILIAHSDPDVTGRLAAATAARGWTSRVAVDVAAARAHLWTDPPDVALVQSDLPPGGYSDVIGMFVGERPRCPVLAMTGGQDTPAGRSAAARRVADGVLADRTDPHLVVDVAIHAAGQGRGGRPCLLALVDHPTTLAALAEHLSARYEVTVVPDPAALRAALQAHVPDAVLLDVDVPGVDVPAICRHMREHPRHSDVPVLALAEATSPHLDETTLAAVEEVVPKPIAGPALLNRLATALDRARRLRGATPGDPLTGLVDSATFEEGFARLAERSLRTRRPVAVAPVSLDSGRYLDRAGAERGEHRTLDRLEDLLAATFPNDDLVVRWVTDELLVAMGDTDRDAGVARVAAALQAFRTVPLGGAPATASRHATFSAAVGEFPTDATDLLSLLGLLADAVIEAKQEGNRVVAAGASPGASECSTDVFIVEDDEALVSLLGQALETRGLRSEHEVNGRAALDRLIGRCPLTARVILLDVDLPETDGLEILRRIAEEGVLSRSRVIMLTASSGEADVQAAMDHGAFDHVAKPFSLPVLTQRLRRALDASA